MVLSRVVCASARPPPSRGRLLRRSSDVSVASRRRVSASIRPAPSPRPLMPRLSDVTVVLKRSASASIRPLPSRDDCREGLVTLTVHAGGAGPSNLTRISHDLVAVCCRAAAAGCRRAAVAQELIRRLTNNPQRPLREVGLGFSLFLAAAKGGQH